MVAVSGRFCVVSSCKISHFGMNPVRGGSPPRDSSVKAAVAVMTGVFGQFIARVLIFVASINLNVRNVADVMMIYISSVRVVSSGLNCAMAIIHPRCAIDE